MMNLKKREGTETGKIACIAFVTLLILSVVSLISFVPVSADVQLNQENGTWSDSFDGATPEAGIAASSNITVADGDVNLSKTSSDWIQTTPADFDAGVLSDVDTATSSGDVLLNLTSNPTLITSNSTEVSVKGQTSTLVKTLTFTKSGASYNELMIASNLKIDSANGNRIAYSDIRVNGTSKFTNETQNTTYVSDSNTLDSSSYADDSGHTIELYLYTDNPQRTANNSLFEVYRTKTYAPSGTIASQVLDTGSAGANWE